METIDKKQFITQFKNQWKNMWETRLDDRVRAEGIANTDYDLLFIDRGTIILATRKYKPIDYFDLLEQHRHMLGETVVPPNPSTGGWRKFINTNLAPQSNRTRRGRQMPKEPEKHRNQQLKKSGRGWLHARL